VVPLAPKSKAPLTTLVPHGVVHATCDPEVISYWSRRAPDANIGIACHRLFVVDVDPRNGGDEKLAALLEEYGPLPTTPTQTTGSGGSHHLFLRPALPLRSRLVHGIDLIHGSRRYIVATPSVLKGGGAYEWLTPPSAALAEAPEWLLRLALRGDNHPMRPVVLPIATRSKRSARATAYARKIPPAISGQGGHTHTFLTACRLVRGFLLDREEAYAVMSEWNRTCRPPWSERDLRRKIDQAIEHGQLPFGALLELETT
jgi:hypothetical protein